MDVPYSKRYVLDSVTADPASVSGEYKTQYKVTFDLSGVSGDSSGNVLTITGVGSYDEESLPVSLWRDDTSTVYFSYESQIDSNSVDTQYVLDSDPGSSLTVSGQATVVGVYKAQYKVIFDQTGVNSGFSGTILDIDEASYGVSTLPESFWTDDNSVINFEYYSPLEVASEVEQNVWVSTAGLSTDQTGSLFISGSGTVTGNYGTQYYLKLLTSH